MSKFQSLDYIAAACVKRNLRNTALIDKAHRLPFCKKNIMLAKILFWDRVYCRITSAMMAGNPLEGVELNVNPGCIEHLKINNLANPLFIEFFFNFHEPLTLAFLRNMRKVLGNGMPIWKKFNYVANEVTELLNIAFIELEGLDISCGTFGGEPLCKKMTQYRDKECTDVGNCFHIMMNNEYKLEYGLFEEILKVAVKYLKKARDKVILIVDYKNMNQIDYEFGPRARARYELCMTAMEQVYFYNWKSGVSFGKSFEGLEPYLIPDKEALCRVKTAWKERQELITF